MRIRRRLRRALRRGETHQLLLRHLEALGQPVRVLDLEGEVLFEHGEGAPTTGGVPFAWAGEEVGEVYASDGAEALAEYLRVLIALAEEKRALGQEALERYREIAFLYEFTERISADLSVREVAGLITRSAKTLIEVDVLHVLVLDPETGKLEDLTPEAAGAQASTPGVGSALVAEVLESGQAELINDVEADGRIGDAFGAVGSLLCLPMRNKEVTVGLLVIGAQRPNAYTANDLKLTVALALQSAVAVENARYTDELTAHRDRLEELVDERTRDLQHAMEQLRHANAILDRMATEDGLTGLPNRRRFEEFLETAWHEARRGGTPLALMMVDVDYFKKYNDHYGHQAGDACLKTVAGALRGALKRKTDFVARYGGEEFVVVLPGATLDQARETGNALCEAVVAEALPHAASEVLAHVSISVGVTSLVPDPSTESPEGLVGIADEALYAAKQAGRNRCQCSAVSSGAAES